MGLYKRVYYMGLAAYVVLLILSVLFYKERIVSPDTSFYIYHIIAGQSFRIESFRFGDVLNQVFPLLASRAGMSLAVVMGSYSLGYMLYYLLCYLACGTMFKRYDLALLVLLLNLLFTTHTFYWVPSQLPQGIALLMVTFALAGGRELSGTRPVTWVLLLAALITVAFFHPLVIVVLVYSLLFFLDRRSLFVSRKLLLLIGGIFFAIIIVKPLLFRNQYEQHAMGGLRNFIKLFPHYFSTYSTERFLHNLGALYYWIPLLFGAISVWYVMSRQWRRLLLFAGSFCGYLLLVNVSFPTAATPVFYIENLYLPLAILLGLPFVYDLLPALARRRMALPLLAIIILSGCVRIYNGHNMYTHRLNYERSYLDKYGNQKVIVKAIPRDIEVLQMLWSNPYEFLLLSELERGKSASILIDDNPVKLGWATGHKSDLIVNAAIVPYRELPARYFHFTDSVTGYQLILNR